MAKTPKVPADDVHGESDITFASEETGVMRVHAEEVPNDEAAVSRELGPFSGNKDRRGTVSDTPELQNRYYDITKIKVKDSLLTLEYDEVLTYKGLEPTRRKMTMTGGLPVHIDMVNAMERLVPFLDHVCKQKVAKGEPVLLQKGEQIDPKLKSEISVLGLSIGATKGVTITGWRKLWGSKGMNLISNYIDAPEGADSWYPYAQQVLAIVDDVKVEAALALEGKCYNPQLSLLNQDEAA